MSIEELFNQRDNVIAEARGILDSVESEKRSFTDEERTKIDDLKAERTRLDDLIKERGTLDSDNEDIIQLRTKFAQPAAAYTVDDDGEKQPTPVAPQVTRTEDRGREHYTPNSSESFFIDLTNARMKGDREALIRLQESDAFTTRSKEYQQRALNNTAAEGGEALTPIHMQDLFSDFRVKNNIIGNLVTRMPLPSLGKTLVIPKQTTAASVAKQTDAASLNTVSNTDIDTDDVTVDIESIEGMQDMSLFVKERGNLGGTVDAMIGRHLAKLLAKDEAERIFAAIRGASGLKSVSYTADTGTFAGLYPKTAEIISKLDDSLPNAWVMHGRRWYGAKSEVADDGRPLISDQAGAANPMSTGADDAANYGFTGHRLHGIPVYVDNNVSILSGAGTNEDTIYVADFSAFLLWDSGVQIETSMHHNFAKSGFSVRARKYMAFSAAHDPTVGGRIVGTGLTAPTFA